MDVCARAAGLRQHPGPGNTGADTNLEHGAFLEPQRITLTTGVTLQYIEGGTLGGDAVLFLHGYTDTGRPFIPTAKHLLASRPDLHVFIVDQRGHGAMGSLVAQELALEHPGRIDRVVLIGTAANVTQNALLRDFVLGEIIEDTWKTPPAAAATAGKLAAYVLAGPPAPW